MKKWVLALIVIISLFGNALAADGLIGEWEGTVSVSKPSLNVSVTITFEEDETFSFQTVGLSSTGTYSLSEGTLTVAPEHISGKLSDLLKIPKNVKAIATAFSIQDDVLTISVDARGAKASATLTRAE